MRILRTYVLREHLAPFFATMGTLTAALLLGHIVKFAELVIAKGVSVFDILRLLIYLIPYMLSFTIPMACLIAMILAFGRLSTDFELIAMRASGVAPLRLVWPVLVTGLVISVLLLVMNDRVVPQTHLAFRRQLKAIGIKQPTAYLEAGTFIREFPPYTIFLYHVEGRQLVDVRIYEPQENGPTRTIIAQRGEFESLPGQRGVQLKLYDGTVDQWDPVHPGTFYKVSFGTYTMTLRAEREGDGPLKKKLKEMGFQELAQEARALREDAIETMPVTLELHRRIASSFSVLIFVMFGLALGLRLHHHERLISFVWVLGIFLTYYLGTVAMNAVALKGWLPPWLAMWTPNFVGAAVSGTMIARTVRR
jgi:lipopolysaccharide export system permease protein